MTLIPDEPDRQSAQYVFGWNDAIELAAMITEKYKRDASCNDSIIGALEHNSNQTNIAAEIRTLKLT